MKRILLTVTALCLSLAALGFAAWALPLSDYEQQDATTLTFDAVSVVERQTDLAKAATARLAWSDEMLLRAPPQLDGLVTHVFATESAPIACGEKVLEIDGFPRFAYCGARPPWESVSSASKGAAMKELVEFMKQIGYFTDLDEPSGAQVRDAIRWYQATLGQPVTGVFQLSDAIWIGADVFTPTSIDLRVGDSLTGGAVVARIEPALIAATIESDGDNPDESLGRVFGLDGSPERFEVTPDGDIVDLTGVQVELLRSGALAEDLPESVTGATRLADPIDLVTVPATSLSSNGISACVFSVDGQATTAIPVEVVSSSVGSVFVRGQLAAGSLVLVNPDRSLGC